MCYVRTRTYLLCPPGHRAVVFASRCEKRRGLLRCHLSKSSCSRLVKSTKEVEDVCPVCARLGMMQLFDAAKKDVGGGGAGPWQEMMRSGGTSPAGGGSAWHHHDDQNSGSSLMPGWSGGSGAQRPSLSEYRREVSGLSTFVAADGGEQESGGSDGQPTIPSIVVSTPDGMAVHPNPGTSGPDRRRPRSRRGSRRAQALPPQDASHLQVPQWRPSHRRSRQQQQQQQQQQQRQQQQQQQQQQRQLQLHRQQQQPSRRSMNPPRVQSPLSTELRIQEEEGEDSSSGFGHPLIRMPSSLRAPAEYRKDSFLSPHLSR